MPEEKIDLFSESDTEKVNKGEKKTGDEVDTILENRCPNCSKTGYNGHCSACGYREEDSELFSHTLFNNDVPTYFCNTCKNESFSEICPICKKNIKHGESISIAKKGVGKMIDKGIFVGIKVIYFNFPSRIGEKKASFDFILEPQTQKKFSKKKKIRMYIDYTGDTRTYTDQEGGKEIEVFQIKVLRREEYNKKSRNWQKINFLNDDEYRAVKIVMESLIKEKNKI